jgi:AraC family transcriptional regulator
LERITDAGAVFETDHRGRSAMRHHRHPRSYATIVLSGAYVEVREAVPEICRSGHIVVHEAAEEHADRFASDTRCLNVELPCEGVLPGSRIVLDGPLGVAVQNVVAAFYGRTWELPEAVKSLQLALLRRAPPQSECDAPRWLHRAIDEFPWAQPIPMREAAASAGVHETHFSRTFRRYFGMTANAYRARARVQHASRLLLMTTSSIACIALSAGFSDQSHLTRTFSQMLGLAPAEYRRTFAR